MLFQWTTIRSGQFRLLERRDPLPWGEPSYMLKTFSAGSSPSYAALLYQHDSSPKTESVVLNGRSFSVQKNALVALMQIEKHKKPAHLWIDCLCVNQSNDLERDEQEQALGRILRDAAYVIAYLNENAPGAVDFCKAMRTGRQRSDLQTDSKGQLKAFRRELDRIGALCANKRVWTHSDLRTDMQVVLYVGPEQFEWADVQRAIGIRRTSDTPREEAEKELSGPVL